MTSWVKAKVNGKLIIAKVGGYTGLSEARTPLGDIMSANRMWLSKEQARNLGLHIGQTVNVSLGRKRTKGKVYKWSRGARQIVFQTRLKLKTAEAKRLMVRGMD